MDDEEISKIYKEMRSQNSFIHSFFTIQIIKLIKLNKSKEIQK